MLMPTRSAVSTVLGLLLLLSWQAVPPAHADAIVLPPDMTAVEGNGAFFRPLGSDEQTTQYAYGSSMLAGADDAVVARDGVLAFAADDIPIGGSPNAFGPFIGFTTPFIYRGGDLLLTIRHTGGGLGFVPVDVREDDVHEEHVHEDDTVLQSVFSDGVAATVGFALAGAAPIIQITFVPENPFDQAAALADQVAALVAGGVLNRGQGQSLVSKLTLTGRGQPDAGRIGAFINELQAMLDSGRLTRAQGVPLLAAARALLISVTAG